MIRYRGVAEEGRRKDENGVDDTINVGAEIYPRRSAQHRSISLVFVRLLSIYNFLSTSYS